jgi:hypothetical protein
MLSIGNKKHPLYGLDPRQRAAKCLNVWRKSHSAYEVCNRLQIAYESFRRYMLLTPLYKKVRKNKLPKAQMIIVQRAARKLLAVELLGGKCCKCGEQNIYVLEFHHSAKNKKHEVSRLAGINLKKYLSEVRKCQLVCANCHALIHTNITKYEKFNRQIAIRMRNMKVRLCGIRPKEYSNTPNPPHDCLVKPHNYFTSTMRNG